MIVRWHLLRGLVAVVISLGVLAAFAGAPVSAAGYARITLHVNECPVNYRGDIFDCHNNRVANTLFYIAGAAKWTNTNGIATGAPASGWKSVRVNAVTASHYAGSYVVCTDQVTHKTLYNGLAAGTTVMITTTAGHLTICDWYLLY